MKHRGTESFRAAVSLEFRTSTFCDSDVDVSFEIHFSTTEKTTLTFGQANSREPWPQGIESISVVLEFPPLTNKMMASWTPADGPTLTLDHKIKEVEFYRLIEWLTIFEGDLEEGMPFHLVFKVQT